MSDGVEEVAGSAIVGDKVEASMPEFPVIIGVAFENRDIDSIFSAFTHSGRFSIKQHESDSPLAFIAEDKSWKDLFDLYKHRALAVNT